MKRLRNLSHLMSRSGKFFALLGESQEAGIFSGKVKTQAAIHLIHP